QRSRPANLRASAAAGPARTSTRADSLDDAQQCRSHEGNAFSADGQAAASWRNERRLAKLRRDPVEAWTRPRPLAAVRIDDAGGAERLTALRRGEPRPGGRLAWAGVQSVPHRRRRLTAELSRRRIRA